MHQHLSQNQEFILELLKLLVPLIVGLHLPQPGYMKKPDQDKPGG